MPDYSAEPVGAGEGVTGRALWAETFPDSDTAELWTILPRRGSSRIRATTGSSTFSLLKARPLIPSPQRMLMETIYDSLCSAGQTIEGLRGSSTAVMVGGMCDDWTNMMNKDWEALPQYGATGAARSIMSNRVSYFMDWHGPSVTLDTACSSSLVAVHLAVQALRNGESRVAVAAGANIILNPGEPHSDIFSSHTLSFAVLSLLTCNAVMYIAESNLHMLFPTGRSRMWDRDADGYARGEGIAAVVLKTLSAALEDGDHMITSSVSYATPVLTRMARPKA